MLFEDLQSRRLIVLKGAMFFGCVISSAAGLCLETLELRTVVLVAVLIWSSARSYYFLFYVLHRYVDPALNYAGLWSIAMACRKRRGEPGAGVQPAPASPPISSPTPPPSRDP